MITIKGKGVVEGVAFGKLSFFQKTQQQVERHKVQDTSAELKRFEEARKQAMEQLQILYQKALSEVGEENAMIFEIHQMMLEDLDYCESITNMVCSQQVNAEYAVAKTADNFSAMFSSMDDPYLQARAADVKDISEKLIHILMGNTEQSYSFTEPCIIAADDLAPSETVQLDKTKVLAFVTRKGSSNSHTAILARTMNIPAIIGVGDQLKPDFEGKDIIVDGETGNVYINPDTATFDTMRLKKMELDRENSLLAELKGQPSITLDGQTIHLYANIGSVTDTVAALNYDAEGIGLFRSEFLYLENQDYPTEEEQFQAYRTVAENMAGKKVIIRTLDIGADKNIDYFQLPKEDNPAMGYRAIRICLTRPELFHTQLRALYRASAFGKIAIMFPMITSVEEVKQIKEIAAQVRNELKEAGVPFDPSVELGIMIETPAAAVISDQLAKEVDFFSVGTNDLTQYTLAIDRQNPKLDRFYQPHHPAILRLIRMAADNAHKNGIWIGICGELGADLDMTETFLAMGIDELSVSPSSVLKLLQKIRQTDVSKVIPKG